METQHLNPFPRYYLMASEVYFCGDYEMSDIETEDDAKRYILNDNPYNIELVQLDVYRFRSIHYPPKGKARRAYRTEIVDGIEQTVLGKDGLPYIDEIFDFDDFYKQKNMLAELDSVENQGCELLYIEHSDDFRRHYDHTFWLVTKEQRLGLRIDNIWQYLWLIEERELDIVKTHHDYLNDNLDDTYFLIQSR